MNMNLNVFMRGTYENWCLRIYQKLYQNVMKHMSANLQTNMVTLNTSNLIYGPESLLCASAPCFLHILRTFIDKMVNWKDPALLLNDSGAPAATMLVNIAIDSLLVAFVKLGHAIGGLYMCVRLHWQESAN
jgi:hypothetical protein